MSFHCTVKLTMECANVITMLEMLFMFCNVERKCLHSNNLVSKKQSTLSKFWFSLTISEKIINC